MRGTALEMTYGDRVRRTRLALGLTQQEFADQIGVDQTLIGRHEKLDQPPTRNRRALASMIQLRYGVDADWLLNGDAETLTVGVLPHPDSNGEPAGYQMQERRAA